MDAILLAAGQGKRLSDFNPDGRPKSLLEFGGKSLLARQLQCLFESGVRHVELVVGYEAEQIIEHVGTLQQRPDVSFAFNPGYGNGSVISLLAARERLLSGHPLLLMNADVLFHPHILQRLVRSGHANVTLLDQAAAPGVKAAGFYRFDAATAAEIATACAHYADEGLTDVSHEDVVREVMQGSAERSAVEDISGLPWLDLNAPADIERAVKEVLPAIRADYPGF